ncbi:MAG TPA: PAS domain S-box protein [Candidatus Krumholzibacteria bacterium]|nr:PAS domain S-box protein [Candidatus Krumholzibacteria bacterium]
MQETNNLIPDTTQLIRLVQALIRNSFDIIKVLDRDLKTIFVSSAVESVLGYTPRELMGTNPLDYVHPDDLEGAREAMQKLATTGEMIQRTLRARHKDGSWRTVEVIVRDLRDDDDIGGFVMNYRDVTARIETERRLEAYRERFEKAFRSCPDSITITSAIDGEILEVNEGFENIVGYTHDEIVGKRTVDVGIWRNPARRAELIEELHVNGHVRDFAIDVVTREGDVRSCVVSAELLEIGQKPCILAVTRDVTQQKEQEEKLRELSETLRREQVDFVRKNVALNEVLQHIEEKKEIYRHEISSKLENLLRPMLRKLREQGRLAERDVDVLERGIQTAFGADINEYKNNVEKLTPRELDILEMIRAGRSSKQIAEALDLSSQTVHKHRQSIRRKLQIDHREINLATYLRSQ